MLRSSCDNISTGLDKDGTSRTTCNFKCQPLFRFLSERFQDGQASSQFSLGEDDLNIKQFFQSTCNQFSDDFSVLNKNHRTKLIFRETFNCFGILFNYRGFCSFLFFLCDCFIQRLLNITARPLIWEQIISSDLLIFPRVYGKEFPVTIALRILYTVPLVTTF